MQWARDWLAQRGALAGVAVAALASIVLVGALTAGRGGAAAPSEPSAGFGEARRASLTIDVPAPIRQTIYGGPGSQGRPIVVIDAGHGGHDPGATSVSGAVAEKDLTLTLARELKDEIVRRGRLRVLLSRDGDHFLSLSERAAIARNAGAALFLSIHADSAANPHARGASIYSLSDVASDAETARVARAQNSQSGGTERESGSVAEILADLALRAEMTASADLATRFVRKSAGRFELRPQPHRFAAFHVLREAEMPAVLFEAGYISNAQDELLLSSANYRQTIVSSLAQAIEADIATRSRR